LPSRDGTTPVSATVPSLLIAVGVQRDRGLSFSDLAV
jgi:hypothetical protein